MELHYQPLGTMPKKTGSVAMQQKAHSERPANDFLRGYGMGCYEVLFEII